MQCCKRLQHFTRHDGVANNTCKNERLILKSRSRLWKRETNDRLSFSQAYCGPLHLDFVEHNSERFSLMGSIFLLDTSGLPFILRIGTGPTSSPHLRPFNSPSSFPSWHTVSELHACSCFRSSLTTPQRYAPNFLEESAKMGRPPHVTLFKRAFS